MWLIRLLPLTIGGNPGCGIFPLGYENILIATGMEVRTQTFFLTIPPNKGLTSILELH